MFRRCALVRSVLYLARLGAGSDLANATNYITTDGCPRRLERVTILSKIMPWLLGIVLSANPEISVGLTILSGDVTPVFSLTNANPDPATPGNQQFFKNILGSGTRVAVLSSAYNNDNAAAEIESFYDSLGGAAATSIAGTVTANKLAGVNLFLVPVPSDAFSASEIAAISDFVKGGGTLFLMGEAADISFGVATNGFINAVLSGLGSHLSLVNTTLDIGRQSAIGNQIVADPLTSDVLAYSYGAASRVAGGKPLFRTKNGTPFTAAEVVVPEPSSCTLLMTILVGVAAHAWRRRMHGA
jgi:hypothetical protein